MFIFTCQASTKNVLSIEVDTAKLLHVSVGAFGVMLLYTSQDPNLANLPTMDDLEG